MSSKNSVPAAVPKELRCLFDRPPLVHGESLKLYHAVRSSLASIIEPRDLLEWLYLINLVNTEWDILRLRSLTADLLSYQQELELARYLSQDIKLRNSNIVRRGPPIGERLDLARMCLEGNAQAKRDVNAVLGKKKRTFHHQSLTAKAFLNVIDPFENTNRMLTLAEMRRDRLLRSIESYRQSLFTSKTIQISKPAITYSRALKSKKTAPENTSSKNIALKEHRAA
jgi:hypothetical protein